MVLKGLTMVWETAVLMGRGFSSPILKPERTVGKEEARRSHSESGLKVDGGEVPNAKSSFINNILWIKTTTDSSTVPSSYWGGVYTTTFSAKNRKLFMRFAGSFTRQRRLGEWKRTFLKTPPLSFPCQHPILQSLKTMASCMCIVRVRYANMRSMWRF